MKKTEFFLFKNRYPGPPPPPGGGGGSCKIFGAVEQSVSSHCREISINVRLMYQLNFQQLLHALAFSFLLLLVFLFQSYLF
jgi:hypothetical protein